MNALAAILAAPAAGAVIGAARSGVAAAAEPFELLLRGAQRQVGAPASDGRSADERSAEAETIRERLAGRLQELATSIGCVAGDLLTLRFGQTGGEVEIRSDHPLSAVLQAEVRDDPQVAADMARLAELEGADAAWQFELG